MSVRFIIGRAGSGKTHHCLESIRTRLRRDAVDGSRLILLVPEQAALQMERALLGTPPEAGVEPVLAAHRAEVLSFRRLAYRVLDGCGGTTRRSLTETARAMVLRHLIARHGSELTYYGVTSRGQRGLARLSGLVERLSATISELIEEAIDPKDLAALSMGDPSARKADAAQAAKLHDLQLLYQAYLDYLGGDKLDPSQFLQSAREVLPRCSWLHGAELWVDGFASFSGQETLTMIALTRLSQSAEITVLIDPKLVDPRLTEAGWISQVNRHHLLSLFGKSLRNLQDLRNRFLEAGLSVDPPIVVGKDPMPRFKNNASLSGLERSLFATGEAPPSIDGPPDRVELVEAPTRRLEVEYAVSRLCRWVRDPGTHYRYRDVAMVTRDLEPYHDLLTAALTARGIPFFIDRRRPVSHHPLVELIRSATAMAVDAMSHDAVVHSLKTGLLPIAADKADELENYLLANHIAGWDAWRGGPWSHPPYPKFGRDKNEPTDLERGALESVNRTREVFWSALGEWLSFATETEGHNGQTWSREFGEWLGRLGTGETLDRWAGDAESDGELDLAEEHRQVWEEVHSLLEDLSFALGEATLSVREFSEVLEAGLSGLTLGLVPPTVDQVLVGAIERSRHPDIKAAILLGFNDGVFPQRAGEDSILNDDDRMVLAGSGVRIRAGARERILDEKLLVYVAVTRPSEALVITYPVSDPAGKELRPSPCVSELQRALPALKAEVVHDPVSTGDTWDVLSPRDLRRRVVWEFASRRGGEASHSRRSKWNALYESVRGDCVKDRVARFAFCALDEPDDTGVSSGLVHRLFPQPLQTSVSQLETYAACPFQFFARYVLRLRERPEGRLEAVDVGSVHHALLEDFLGLVAQSEKRLADLTDDQLVEGLHNAGRRVAAKLALGGVISDARNAYVLRRTASSLARVLQAQRRLSSLGRYRPRAVELPFGFDVEGSLPALVLTTPRGRRVVLRGYLDRVDLAEVGDELLGIVVDYKHSRGSGLKKLDLSRVYHGVSLQLPAYLLVLARGGRTLAGRSIQPAGGLFVPLGAPVKSVNHPSEVKEDGAGGAHPNKPRGLLRFDRFDSLDSSTEGKWSEGYSVFRTKDGAAGHLRNSDAAEGAAFEGVLSHAEKTMAALADGILDGDFGVRPYRLNTFTPCGWCAMRSVCRFEYGISEMRFLDRYPREEVLERMSTAER